MFKNKMFQEGLLWLAITGLLIYSGLFLATGYNVFLQGVWAGTTLVNAAIRFAKAHQQEKGKSAK